MELKFDFNRFLHRKQLKQKDAAQLVGASMGLIGTWAAGKASPSYEKMAKLIENGITAQELFGEELGGLLISNSANIPKDSDFLAGVEKAMSDMKTRGLIREEVEQAIAAMKAKGEL